MTHNEMSCNQMDDALTAACEQIHTLRNALAAKDILIRDSVRIANLKYRNASAHRDALEQNANDAWAMLATIGELKLEQSLAGAIFDLVQMHNARIEEVTKTVANQCAEIAMDADTNYDAKEKILTEFGIIKIVHLTKKEKVE